MSSDELIQKAGKLERDANKKFEFDDLRISGFDGGAFATFLGTVYFQTDGVDLTVQYRYTINFIERNGELKIAADHLSRKL